MRAYNIMFSERQRLFLLRVFGEIHSNPILMQKLATEKTDDIFPDNNAEELELWVEGLKQLIDNNDPPSTIHMFCL